MERSVSGLQHNRSSISRRNTAVHPHSRPWRYLLPSLLFLALSLFAAQARAAALPVLSTAQAAHNLSRAEALRGYPIHLARAQITFNDPSLGALFLMDATDGIFVDTRGQPPPSLHPGDLVSVDAFSGPGKIAPVLTHARFRILGSAPLPLPSPVSFDRLLSGAFDSRWVSIEGIVRSVRRPSEVTTYAGEPGFGGNNLILTLASGPITIDVITDKTAAANPSFLIDAKVRLRAAAGSRFNQRSQLTGVHVYMPDLSYLQVLDPAPADPFALPLASVTGITRTTGREPGHRVHIRGIVTSTFGNLHFSLKDDDHGIFVTAQDPVTLHPGDRLDVVGFPAEGDYTAYLDSALIRRISQAPVPVPVPVTAAEALSGDHDAEAIELRATVVEIFRGAQGVASLQMDEAGFRYLAVLPPDSPPGSLDSLRIGSLLRVRGICVIHANEDKTPRYFDLLLRSPDDVQLLRAAAWWTPRHTLGLAATLSLLVLLVFTRNLGLRRRVAAQTRQIRCQLDEARALRIEAEAATREKSQTLASLLTAQRDLLLAQEKLRYQATHDGLTGLWNRVALLDFLHKEIDRTRRTQSSLGLLLLDVDHFKPVNDTHGHLAGDDVLREIGLRITRSIRPYDVAGRYGGEEFLVILPGCDSLQTESSAERLRVAIGALPFRAGDAELSLTISIGATVASCPEEAERQESDADLLSRADIALYEAKSAGRNRTVLNLAEPVPLES